MTWTPPMNLLTITLGFVIVKLVTLIILIMSTLKVCLNLIKKLFYLIKSEVLTKNFESFISCYLSPIPESISAIGFCETHLTSDIEPQYQLPGFKLFTNNNESNSGDVALYIRESLKGSLITDLSVCTMQASLRIPIH